MRIASYLVIIDYHQVLMTKKGSKDKETYRRKDTTADGDLFVAAGTQKTEENGCCRRDSSWQQLTRARREGIEL